MRLFVSGSLAYDRIMTFPGRFADHILPDKIHILNVCFLVDGLTEHFGGTAGNVAYNLSLLGEHPLILGTAGKDFGNYEKRLRSLGLSLEGIRPIESEFTAGAYITTDLADNQIIGFNPGAMKHPSRYSFERVPPEDAVGLVAPGNVEDMLAYPRAYREQRIPFIWDPGQQIPVIPGEKMLEAIAGAMALITNDYELEMIMTTTGKTRAELLDLCGAVITTLGEKGSVVVEDGRETHVAPVAVERAVDPTGAGDAYRAGLLKGLALGKPLAEAARFGSTCASFCVEQHGTQEHEFTWAQFAARHEKVFGPL